MRDDSLTRGKADPRFGFSREKCCWAARYILAIHRGLGDDFRATRSWSIVFHTLNALVILAVDLCRTSSLLHYENAQLMWLVEQKIHEGVIRKFIERTLLRPFSFSKLDRINHRCLSRRFELSSSSYDMSFRAIRSTRGSMKKRNRDVRSFILRLTSQLTRWWCAAATSNSIFRHDVNRASPPSPPRRPFDPNLPFSRPLPLPISADPFAPPTSYAASTSSNPEMEFAQLWNGLGSYRKFYAVPDVEEWQQVVARGAGAWSAGIDLLQ